MRVLRLAPSGREYTANVYLIRGDWNRLEDVNALVDVGRDPAIISALEAAATGLGKRKLDRVVLTHSHYDHVALLPEIRERFQPEVCAFSSALTGVDRILKDGDHITLGDDDFEVISVPGHTADSICLFNQTTGALFTGDAPLLINSAGGTYESEFVAALRRLVGRDLRILYPGHGNPITENCNSRLRASLQYASDSDSTIDRDNSPCSGSRT